MEENAKSKLKLHQLLEADTPPIRDEFEAYDRVRDYVAKIAKGEGRVEISTRVSSKEEAERCCGADLAVLCGPNHLHPFLPLKILSYDDYTLEGSLAKLVRSTVELLLGGLQFAEKLQSLSGFLLPGLSDDTSIPVIQVRACVGSKSDFQIRLSFKVVKSKEEFDAELKSALREKHVFESSVESAPDEYFLRLSEEQLDTVAVAIREMKSDSQYHCRQVASGFAILVEAIHTKRSSECVESGSSD